MSDCSRTAQHPADADAAAPAVEEVVPWADLPKPPLQLVLKHVPQRHRLGHASSCALVCSSWAEAAAAATDSLVVDRCAGIGSLQLWLQRHGGSLTQLHVRAAEGDVAEHLTVLPCPKLADLQLVEFDLRSNHNLVTTLTALPRLRRLSLTVVVMPLTGWCRGRCELFVPSGLLQQLPALTHLELRGVPADEALQGLSSLTSCSHLALECQHGVTADGFAAVQELQGLTFLQLMRNGCVGPPLTLPSLDKLTALQQLHVEHDWQLQTSQLAGITQLQRLELVDVDLQGSSTAVLALLPSFQHLTALQLRWISGLDSCPPAAFGAISSCSNLRYLELGPLFFYHHAGLWQYVLPTSKQHSNLTRLTLTGLESDLLMTASAFERCMQCCPNLRKLQLFDMVAEGVQLNALLQLPALTSLSVHMREPADADAGVLVQLTLLRELTLHAPFGSKVALAGVLAQLTTLKHLTCLRFSNWCQDLGAFKQQLQLVDGNRVIANQAPPGSPPDVWSQLLAATAAHGQ